MNNDLAKIHYDHYVSEYGRLAADVRKICQTPSDCDYLVSDEDIMNFMYAFKALGQSLESAKSYSLFDWNDLNEFMSEDEFLDYKAWYFTFYDELKEKGGMDEVLATLDSGYKIVRSNKIDKAYIISVIKRISLHGGEDREKNIELLKREIDHTDNKRMRHKAPIMKEFINILLPALAPDADIEKAYGEFENEVFNTCVAEFSKKHDLDPEFVRSMLNEFFADRQSINKIVLRERLADKNLPPIQQAATINSILTFMGDMYNKFK